MLEPIKTESHPDVPFFRFVAAVNAVICIAYIAWRYFAGTINPADPGPSWYFYIAELTLCLATLSSSYTLSMRIKRTPTPLAKLDRSFGPDKWPSLDIFIPTVNEPIEIIQGTVKAAAAIDYPKELTRVFVLDDAARAEVREWAESARTHHTITYIAREKTPGVPHYAKAGNLNHALLKSGTTGDLVLILDADHVCTKEIAQILVPYFLEADGSCSYRLNHVAYVQAPDRSWSSHPGNQLAADFPSFHGPLQQGNDGMGCTWLTGTAAILRRKALEEIGGFYRSVTEDVPTGFTLLAAGWESRFHSNHVTAGMPPVAFEAMLHQRERWALGDFQYCFPLIRRVLPKLTWRQQFSLLNIPLFLFARILFATGFLILPPIEILRGRGCIEAPALDLAAFIIPYTISTRLLRMIGFKSIGPRAFFWAERLYCCSAFVVIVALVRRLIAPSQINFWVSPKQRGGYRDYRVRSLAAVFLFIPLAALGLRAGLQNIQATSIFSLNTFYSITGSIWFFNALICLWPAVWYLFRDPRYSPNYFAEAQDPPHPDPWWRWLLLPTNLAPLMTVIAGFITLYGTS
jgi:cellulose synthase (UDP-forming)